MRNFFSRPSTVAVAAVTLIPSLALALSGTFKDVIMYVISLINILIPILFALALVVFFWGLSKFVINADNKTSLENGKKYMMWGILALFFLFSYRSIIAIFARELEIGNGDPSGMFLPTNGTE